MLIYNGIEFVPERNEWKRITEAERLDDKGIFKIGKESDKVHKLDIIKFNYSCITLRTGTEDQTKFEYGENIDMKIDGITVGYINKPGILSADKDVEYCFGDSVMNHTYSFGRESTTIELDAVDSENMGDVYCRAISADTNYGSEWTLRVRDGSNPAQYMSYLMFNTSMIEETITLEKASIVLTVYGSYADGYNVSIATIDNHTWNEDQPTWNNRMESSGSSPYVTGDILSNINVTSSTNGDKFTWNITSEWVENQINNYENISFAIVPNTTGLWSNYIGFGAKEYASGYRPILNITYSGGDGTPPNWTNNETNGSEAGTEVLHSVLWQGAIGCVFGFCNGTLEGDVCENITECTGNTLDCSEHQNETYCEYDSGCTWNEGGAGLLDFETFDTGTDLQPVNTDWNTTYSVDSGCVWWKDSDGTASSGTGVCSGAYDCPGDDGGYDDNEYAYVETSSGQCNTGTGHAYLNYVDEIDTEENGNVHIYFAYNMYGLDIGILNLQVYNGTWNTEWSLSGDQGTDWGTGEINLSGYSGNVSIRFDYDRNGETSYRGDVAVDILNITDMGTSISNCSGTNSSCESMEIEINCTNTGCGWNQVGGWENDTWETITDWFNVSKYINETEGATIGWQEWCNDTDDEWNWTGIFNYATTGSEETPEMCWTSETGKLYIPPGCKYYTNTKESIT